MSIMEQRYRAVIEIENGSPVTEVAARYGVSRQTVHTWKNRYLQGGLAALADHSHRPRACPHRTSAEIEAVVCEMRRQHPAWGPARLAFELGRKGVSPVPSQATLYRILVRNTLITPGQRRRPRSSYTRWQRDAPMQLWQMDLMGGVFLADGTELKLLSGIDDHSRFAVIAHLLPRASARGVCTAFATAMRRHGIPEEVLTDNGKQFTGRFTRPRPVEVLFERICRENGITTRNTAIRSPTTTGKVERWHRTVREEFLATHDPFPTLAAAQAALDTWITLYNTTRPHQALNMASPATAFHRAPVPNDQAQPEPVPLKLPAELAPAPTPTGPQPDQPGPNTPVPPVTAVEFTVTVPASGNLGVLGQQLWLGRSRAATQLTIWVDGTTLHAFDGTRCLKTRPLPLTGAQLTRLRRQDGARPGRPAPSNALPPGPLPPDAVIEVHRTVNRGGCVALGGTQFSVGMPLAGHRVVLRLDAHLVHVITDGQLRRTLPSPLTPAARSRLHGARLAGPPPQPEPTLQVTRVVSGQGTLHIAGCKLQIGTSHRGKVVTVTVQDTHFRITDGDTDLGTYPRTKIQEVSRRRASGHIDYGT
ncbi:IS481 family transposase [Streptacidiphilus sp. MAP12-20]|uniref:IS481 family transposase n=1 Tax=Streptacidiphilus sp. MAP12-20 TaxID=3156299 RepID=UPI00351537B5